MSVDSQPVSLELSTAFDNWNLLNNLLRKSEALISRALSRLDRGDRLRTAALPISFGLEAYKLAKSSKYETEAHIHLSVVPELNEFFRSEIIKIRNQIEEILINE